MKIIFIMLLFLFVLGCKKYVMNEELNFVPNKSMKIKNINSSKGAYVSIGSYTIRKDSVVSQFKIESKYSLIVIKLKNVSNNLTFRNHVENNYPTPGYFSIVDEGLYEVKVSPGVFAENYKINSIDLFSDGLITDEIKNDSITSFNLTFNKYVLKFNNDDSKVIYSTIEYYGLKKINANILFYKVENDTFVFVLTPVKGNLILPKNILYEHLFGKI